MTVVFAALSLVACTDGEIVTDAPTWHQDIAPLVEQSCAGCHTAGGVIFPLDDYDVASALATEMADAVEEGLMPPFRADETDECVPRFGWKDDMRLNDHEKQLLRDWADAGAPEGDRDSATALPEPLDLSLLDPSLTLEPDEPYTATGTQDQFQCFVLDPGFTDTYTFINGLQINPGNPEVVHHVLVYSDQTGSAAELAGDDGRYDCFGGIGVDSGSLLAAWAPGSAPSITPQDSAFYVEAGGLLVMQIHYHPTTDDHEPDLTTLDLRTQTAFPAHIAFMTLVGNAPDESEPGQGLLPGPNDRDDQAEFRIPAGIADHTETMNITFDTDLELKLYAAGTHMHYVGQDMIIRLDRDQAEGDHPESECLVQTPKYDFDWQRWYEYDAPVEDLPLFNDGDSLWMQCRYNNTMANENVARGLAEAGLSEPVDVGLGEETLDEMCLAVLGVLYTL
jgi:hypothetical protein